jgi:DNA-binding NarL/FixJ family response regulator
MAQQMAAIAASEQALRRVVVADDSFLMREAILQVIDSIEGLEVVAECQDGDALWAAVEEHDPDVVVTDIRMPPSGDDEGIRIAQRLAAERPEVGVVVLSQYARSRFALELLGGGTPGRAYLLKERVRDIAQLASAIEVVALGGVLVEPTLVPLLLESADERRDSALAALTPRERQILAEMAEGNSNAAIAQHLFLTKRAVEKHIGAIFARLELEDESVVSRRVAAVLMYLGRGRPGETPFGS